MVTFILPGYTATNQKWCEDVAESLKVEGDIRQIFWDHWQDENQRFNPQEKARLLSHLAPNIFVNIIAKSIGTLVAAYMMQNIPMQIKKVVFCGIPVNDLSEEEIELIKKVVVENKDKIVIYQNENDPHGSFAQVKDFGKVISKPGSDHEYPYFDDFNKFLG